MSDDPESFSVCDVYRASNSEHDAMSAEVIKMRDRIEALEAQLSQANAALEAADAALRSIGWDFDDHLSDEAKSFFAAYRKARGRDDTCKT